MLRTDSRHGQPLPILGLRLGVARAGIRYSDRDDLVLMEVAESGTCAGVFTRNRFCAAPVTLARTHLERCAPRYLLINSGNANAGTGKQGMVDAQRCCSAVAELTGCQAREVLPFSTGVIGQRLPVERLERALPHALEKLDECGWGAAAKAIMTTDTVPKSSSRAFEISGRTVTVTGMAKGAGMIRPDMATMLAFVATDAAVDRALLQSCLSDAVERSFNAITVDGDTSTNDACMLVASGTGAAAPIEDARSEAYRLLSQAVAGVCADLSRAIVQDGEGATRLVEIVVTGASDREEASEVAYTIAHSPLVKTAMFAADPNWGRILAAVGRANVADLDVSRVRIYLDDVSIVRDGGCDPDYREEAGRAVMDQEEYVILINLGRGASEARILTCDLSYDYVKINAEYRT